MDYAKQVDIAVDPGDVWTVLMDVTAWPTWTSSVTSVELVGAPPMTVGSEVRMAQPGLAKATWKVTVLDGRLFTWVSRHPGVVIEADHEVEPTETGARVTLRIRQSGPLAWLIGALYGSKTRQYVDTEAAGLRTRCEPTA
jgi:uncharacterized membrane protein